MRIAFKMKLKEGCASEYQERHQKVWPEVTKLLRQSGVEEYSIFIDHDTETLYAFQKIRKGVGSQHLGHYEVIKKWWSYMSDIMEVNEDDSPVSVELEEVFYLSST